MHISCIRFIPHRASPRLPPVLQHNYYNETQTNDGRRSGEEDTSEQANTHPRRPVQRAAMPSVGVARPPAWDNLRCRDRDLDGG